MSNPFDAPIAHDVLPKIRRSRGLLSAIWWNPLPSVSLPKLRAGVAMENTAEWLTFCLRRHFRCLCVSRVRSTKDVLEATILRFVRYSWQNRSVRWPWYWRRYPSNMCSVRSREGRRNRAPPPRVRFNKDGKKINPQQAAAAAKTPQA